MKTKEIIIGAIILALIILVSIFLIKIPEQGESLPQVVMLPNINFEGTIVSLSLIGGEEEGGDITRPRDTAVVKIDKINSISSDFDWVFAGIEEGNEITIHFQYSSRPAKIRSIYDPEAPVSSGGIYDPEAPVSSGNEVPVFGNETSVSATLSFTREDGYFVYSIKSGTITQDTETILTGLKESSQFKATGWYGYGGIQGITIGEYEIIS